MPRTRSRLWMMTLAAAALAAALCVVSGVSLSAASWLWLAGYGLAAVAGVRLVPERFGRLAPLVRCADAIALMSTISMLGAVFSYLTMRHSGALADGALARADALLGSDWAAIRRMVEAAPPLLSALTHAYTACFVLPLLLIVLLGRAGRWDRIDRLLVAYAGALAVTLILAIPFPAEAAFTYFDHAAPPQNAVEYGAVIAALRDRSLSTIDLSGMSGIITFPSFHAAMAILFAWAAWPLRRLRWPMVAVNVAMGIAAVPVGGHYVVDLVAGTLIAILAIRLSVPRLSHAEFTIGDPTANPRLAPAAI